MYINANINTNMCIVEYRIERHVTVDVFTRVIGIFEAH